MARFISDEDRRRVATGWDPRVSTLREYARSVGYSERAIRNWRARPRHDGGISVPGGAGAVPVQAAVDALQARLEELEAAVDAARAAVAAARAALDACRVMPGGTGAASDDGKDGEHQFAGDAPLPEPAEAQDVPPVEVLAQPAHEADAVRPVPMPAPGVFW